MNRVPPSYLSALVELARQQGVDQRDLFHPDDLDQGQLSVADAAIDEISFNQALNGLKVHSSRFPLMLEYGKLLAHQLSEPYLRAEVEGVYSLRDAVEREFCGHNPHLDFTLQERGDRTRLVLLAPRMVDAEVVEFKLRTLYRFLLCLCELERDEISVEFSHTVPVYGADTQSAFASDLRFSRTYNALVVASEQLSRPLPGQPVRHDHNGDPVIDRLRQDHPLIRDTLDYIELNIAKVPLKIEDAAGELNMSARTLQRHLKRYEVTFVQLRDCVKKHHSLRMLKDHRLNLASISDQLGFADVSGFHHAFKRWTGHSPKEYRQRYCG
ncbi:helix-turn-helix transcriptional regulator [Aestuariirhabdus litorea]|uniref:AraC family transcriptional regulator n=1 Tax=Aestuariirhabdus litorea TaxID=2528527 RepID=A0A3P3VMN7_9GAMM|nr:AraC family transcriptional regulator [Aestuariirhabdus litorea]RRJ82989.1 AraC family transcriptional regulator [Aestuariirhabdus litorea]RWW93148.1 helix-turn-helix domain-containing protein [Endozoicomonadaceae bacterium GTF-13]